MPNLRRGMMGAAGAAGGEERTGFRLYSWGKGTYGRLGHGNVTDYSSPVQVGSDSDWAQLRVSYLGAMAIKTDNTLWGWGKNGNGLLGLGNVIQYSSPVQVGSLTDWRAVVCGQFSTLGFKTDGTAWVWGSGQYGQLAQNNVISYSSPVQVGSLTNWSSSSWLSAWGSPVGGGWKVIKPDGTLWTWGNGANGAGGTGNVTYYSSPVQIGSLTNWYRGTLGGSRGSFVRKTDGTFWIWGRSGDGVLGNNSTGTISSPVQLGSLTNWKSSTSVSLYNYKLDRVMSGFGGALKDDGTLWAWGWGRSGRTGHGNEVDYSSPVQIGSLTTWYRPGFGYDSTMALNTSGEAFVWGRNKEGQLGLGNVTYYSSPVQLGSDTNWAYTSAGRYVQMALKSE